MSRLTRASWGMIIAVIGLTAVVWWNFRSKPQAEALHSDKTPATVTNKVSEEAIGHIVLSDEAEARLGVETAFVDRASTRQVRVYGGEVLVPVGRTIVVSAPLAGTLRAPTTGVPVAGRLVEKGEHIFYLAPMLSPEASTTFAASRVDAEGQVNNAATQLELTKLALSRAERLFQGDAGSKRGVEEAKAQYDTARRALEAAESRLAVLTKALDDASAGRATPIPIAAPETGMLRNVSALADQNVPTSAVLFEVIDLTEVWVRVPIYVGDRNEIAADETVTVGNLNVRAGDRTWNAAPVEAPPSANAMAATVDLYYSLDNREANLTPGQRVGVSVPLTNSADSLVVPWSAVIFDIHGGTWVYQRLAPKTYVRQRVVVRYSINGVAVLAAGPPIGVEVVTAGAQELFGAETGYTK